MALAAGTRLGPYEVTGQLGVGGMGEVYRARDTKLGRGVAIKTLPSALAQDPDRLARFEREAKLLAALNHAHIGAIYGLDEHEGAQFIAMELVEGQTLEDKLKDGPLPVEEALRIALQIAEALEAAHEKGVVHRDLKPANIMLTRDGVVKVLDFGLAKAFAGDPNQASPAHSPALSMAMTQQGLILGTAGYMSPEQASGQATDQRADIWAFGVVLYEMLTGLPLFSGETVPHILAAVLQTEPDWKRLPSKLHPRLRQLLERCLKKKVRDRYHSISDVRVDIEEALKDPEGAAVSAMAAPTKPDWRRVLPLTGAVLIAGVTMGLGARYVFPPSVSATAGPPASGASRPVRRFSLDIGPTTPIANTTLNTHIALSRDGRRLAYAMNVGARTQLFVRELDEPEARAVPDSAGAQHPFFSPDGEWVAFFADGTDNKLKRVAFRGGPAQALADISGAGGGYWGDDGYIVYSTNPGGMRSLLRIPAAGGEPEYLLPQPEPGADGDVWPAPLPGGKALLFVLRPRGNGPIEDGNVAVLSLDTREYRVLIRGAHRPQYVPTGHIVFVRSGALWAVPFDAERLAITGPEVAVIDDVQQNGSIGGAVYTFSNDGLLSYLAGSASTGVSTRDLIWVDRDGQEQPLGPEPGAYWNPRLSPDGERLAVRVEYAGGSDIWVYDLVRGTSSQLTFDASAYNPVWTPDGARVVFGSGSQGSAAGMQSRAADGTGQVEQISSTQMGAQRPMAVLPDGGALVYVQGNGSATNVDLDLLRLESEADPTELLATTDNECCAAISPNGRWLAYASDETGQYEVFVKPFPNVDDGKWRISNDGGTEPRWKSDGSELFFLAPGAVRAVAIDDSAGFRAGASVELFPLAGNYWEFNETAPNYDVSPDGQRFLMMRVAGADTDQVQRYARQTPLTTVENWFEELRRLAPPGS